MSPHPPYLLAAAVLAVAVSGCTVSVSTGSRDRPSSPTATKESPGPVAMARNVELRRTPGDLPVTLGATVQSLRDYWDDQMPAVYGRPFQELRGGVQAKSEASPAWSCGGQRVTYPDIRGNAFYCGGPQDDYIAYDAAFLLPALNKEFGSLTPSVVLAHEWGHAVQARAGVDAPSVVRELQADCFAGAWVAFAQRSRQDPVGVAASALDTSVRALPALRDQPGTPASNAQAHGLAFDRVNAYQTGYESGAERCARFPQQGGVLVTEVPFQTVQDAQSGGNLSYEQTVQFAVESLDAYWPANLPGLGATEDWQDPDPTPVGGRPLPDCPGDDGYDPAAVAAYCSATNQVAWSDATLAQVHDVLGDVGAASALSLAWARSGQVQAGIPDSGVDAQLQQVCATGAWLSAVGSGSDGSSSEVELSPGDLDEGLFAALSPLAPGQDEEVEGSSFERADAYRTGLLGGLDQCVVRRQ